MNFVFSSSKYAPMSGAALLIAASGSTISIALFYADLIQNWMAVVVAILLTMLITVYLQLISIQARHAARMVATSASELVLFQELLKNEKIGRSLSQHALQLQDRAIELSAVAISIYDATRPNAPLLYVNPAFERMTGFCSDELLGTACYKVHVAESCCEPAHPLKVLLDAKSEGNLLLHNRRKDGTLVWTEMHFAPVGDATGRITHFVATQTDVTALKVFEERVMHTACYDALTGLANRSLLRDRVCTALSNAAVQQRKVWILFLGLDRFKLVNEASGHDAGDQVLKILAERLGHCVSVTDTISRFGGDEFVVLLQAPPDHKAATDTIESIMAQVALPVHLDGNNVFLSCSIGISVFPTDGNDADILIQHADSAMHGAKMKGPNSFHYFTPQMNERAVERSRMEADLRVALAGEQFFLQYQPQVDLRTGRIVGMEALIRWQHPQRGKIAPADFIGLAEETGMIVSIGAWVMQTACRQMKIWQNAGFGDLRVSVNLSAKQFSDENLVASIATMLHETALDPRFLELELTESLVMTDVDGGFKILQALKLLGISLAVDDFGTGYSSLAYLKRLPIDTLKIDRSFVSDITCGVDDAVIVTSIISLAHNLRLSVVAEGVETNEQLLFLQLNGCDEIQGFRFSHPVSAADLTTLLEQRKSLPPFVKKDLISHSACTTH